MGRGLAKAETISTWPKETAAPRVLIVMPAYNEHLKVREVLGRVQTVIQARPCGARCNILVVNDGSKDGTAYLAAQAGAIVVSHPYNLGYGVACQTGFKYARRYGYDYVIQMDADGQHEPESIPDLLRAVMQPNVDVALGSRWLGKTAYKGPLLRKFGKFFFAFLASALTGLNITDPTTGFQALTRQVVHFYCSNVYPVDYPDADMIIMLKRAGFRIQEVPVTMYRNETGQSMHAGLIRPIYYGMKMMLSIFMTLLRDDRKLQPIRPLEDTASTTTSSPDLPGARPLELRY